MVFEKIPVLMFLSGLKTTVEGAEAKLGSQVLK